MTFATVAFLVFAFAAIAAALMVILSRNPVHSVIFLITTFISVAGLFVLMGAEYLAMLLVVVYVGAVAVLFMFVVMMLDVDFAELKGRMTENAPFGLVMGVVLLVELAMVVGVWKFPSEAEMARSHPMPKASEMTATMDINNAEALGMVLYTDYVHYFQIAGMILLVAMIGAIILTFRERTGVKKQNIANQVGRTRAEAIEVVEVQTGQGI